MRGWAVRRKNTFALPSRANAPTEHGAILIIRDRGGQDLRLDLPDQGWKALGKGAKGYRYRDKRRQYGPCSMVLLKGGRRIKATCNGKQITLRPPFSNPVEVTLRMGTISYCAAFHESSNNTDAPSSIHRRRVSIWSTVSVLLAASGGMRRRAFGWVIR